MEKGKFCFCGRYGKKGCLGNRKEQGAGFLTKRVLKHRPISFQMLSAKNPFVVEENYGLFIGCDRHGFDGIWGFEQGKILEVVLNIPGAYGAIGGSGKNLMG
jgi:hypothetical protein